MVLEGLEERDGTSMVDEPSLTFVVLEGVEERDGTSTVNGPDVVRISRQPWSGGPGEGTSEWIWGDPKPLVFCFRELCVWVGHWF